MKGVMGEIKSLGRRGIAVFGDVSNREDVHRMVTSALSQVDSIDVVVNNAGVLIPNSFEDTTEAQWDTIITANCICPGVIETEMTRTMGKLTIADKAEADKWRDQTALGRLGQPEDIVGPVCFLASDASAFVTGPSLNVDGGIVMN